MTIDHIGAGGRRPAADLPVSLWTDREIIRVAKGGAWKIGLGDAARDREDAEQEAALKILEIRQRFPDATLPAVLTAIKRDAPRHSQPWGLGGSKARRRALGVLRRVEESAAFQVADPVTRETMRLDALRSAHLPDPRVVRLELAGTSPDDVASHQPSVEELVLGDCDSAAPSEVVLHEWIAWCWASAGSRVKIATLNDLIPALLGGHLDRERRSNIWRHARRALRRYAAHPRCIPDGTLTISYTSGESLDVAIDGRLRHLREWCRESRIAEVRLAGAA